MRPLLCLKVPGIIQWRDTTSQKKAEMLFPPSRSNNSQSTEKLHNYYSLPNKFGLEETEKKG
jgi:hypothetical protein